MDPTTVALIAQSLISLVQVYRAATDKPADWVPTVADWDDLKAKATLMTAAEYKRQAAQSAP